MQQQTPVAYCITGFWITTWRQSKPTVTHTIQSLSSKKMRKKQALLASLLLEHTSESLRRRLKKHTSNFAPSWSLITRNGVPCKIRDTRLKLRRGCAPVPMIVSYNFRVYASTTLFVQFLFILVSVCLCFFFFFWCLGRYQPLHVEFTFCTNTFNTGKVSVCFVSYSQ